MRGVQLEFYEVDTPLQLPSNLKVGALYFIRDTKQIRVNHGGGKIVDYGGVGAMEDLLGVLPILKGGTGADTVEGARDNLGITADKLELKSAIETVDTRVQVQAISNVLGALETTHAADTTRLDNSIAAEAATRATADQAINMQLAAIAGKVQYMPAKDFGTEDPTQQQLTDWALENLGGTTIPNSTSIINLFDGGEWIYNETTSEWVSLGNSNVDTATKTVLGVVKGGELDVDATGGLVLPIATDTTKGAIKAGSVSEEPYRGTSVVKVDSEGLAYVDGVVPQNILEGLMVTPYPLAGSNPVVTVEMLNDPFTDIFDRLAEHESDITGLGDEVSDVVQNFGDAIMQEITDRQAGDTAAVNKAASELATEVSARRAAITGLQSQVDGLLGKIRYMPSKNFETPTPAQADLTAWAKLHTGLTIVENATSIVNNFDGQEWIYDNTANVWVSVGLNNVSTATNTTLGVVKGDTSREGGIEIRVDGSMISPKASITKYGGIRVNETKASASFPEQQLGIDSNGQAYVAGLTQARFRGLQAKDASSTNPYLVESDMRWNA
jgi:hypothetical protein